MPISLITNTDGYKIGFSDEQMSAFAIARAIEYEKGQYDFTLGSSKESLNEITKKYFGTTISNFENKRTTVLENGNIASTGWDFSSFSYVLKEMTTTETGSIKAIFYQVGMLRDGMDYNQYFDNVMNGRFENFGEILLTEIEFFEKTDENDEFSVEIISVNSMGVATEPYLVYGNE